MNQKPIIEITVNENAVIHFELWPEIAPIACASVMRLAEKRIFDGRAIERLEPGFVLQPLFFDGVDPQIDIMIKPEFKTNPENAKITFHRGRDCGYGAQSGRMRRQGHEHLGAGCCDP